MAKELREAGAGGLSSAPLEELRRRFHHSDFLGYGGGDPLVEGNAILCGKALGSLLDRNWKLQGVHRQLSTTPRGTNICILN